MTNSESRTASTSRTPRRVEQRLTDLADFRAKSERNARVQARYDAMMSAGKRGHYETMFKIVREEVEAERERCAKIAESPGFIEARDTEWDEGVNHAKSFIASAIRSAVGDRESDAAPQTVA